MKIVTWNVNGLRATIKKGFWDIFDDFDADIFCLQETKMQEGQAEIPLENHFEYWNSAEKKVIPALLYFLKQSPCPKLMVLT